MPNSIAAIYEHGIFRPLMPLHLREQQRVQVQIITEEPWDAAEQVLEQLVCAGRISPSRRLEEPAPLSQTQRAALARMLGEAVSVPLSQVILEERDGSTLVKHSVNPNRQL